MSKRQHIKRYFKLIDYPEIINLHLLNVHIAVILLMQSLQKLNSLKISTIYFHAFWGVLRLWVHLYCPDTKEPSSTVASVETGAEFTTAARECSQPPQTVIHHITSGLEVKED